MKESWYARKQIGKIPWYSQHPDVKRDRLNRRGMRKLNRLDRRESYELYLRIESRLQILAKVVLRPLKWSLSLISPSSKGAAKEVDSWQLIASQRYGKVRYLILQRNVERDIWKKK